jgi:hypothetical protein
MSTFTSCLEAVMSRKHAERSVLGEMRNLNDEGAFESFHALIAGAEGPRESSGEVREDPGTLERSAIGVLMCISANRRLLHADSVVSGHIERSSYA